MADTHVAPERPWKQVKGRKKKHLPLKEGVSSSYVSLGDEGQPRQLKTPGLSKAVPPPSSRKLLRGLSAPPKVVLSLSGTGVESSKPVHDHGVDLVISQLLLFG